MKTNPITLANKIISILIEEKLTLSEQLQIINAVKERIEFCRTTAKEIKKLYQLELFNEN